MPYRRLVCLQLLIGAALVASVSAFNLAIDPFQRFRVARDYPIPFEGVPEVGHASRYIAPGLARHYPHDTLIVGSSTAAGFTHELVERHMPGRALKLTIGAGKGYEQGLVAALALRSQRPRRVIWLLESFAFDQPPRLAVAGFPRHLYEDDWRNSLVYLSSYNTLRVSFDSLRQRYREARPPVFESECPDEPSCGTDNDCQISRAYTWDRGCPVQKAHYYDTRGIRRAALRFLHELREAGPVDPEALLRLPPSRRTALNLQQNVGRLVAAFPGTRFDLVLPPHSIIYWAHAVPEDRLAPLLTLRSEVALLEARFPNVRVFDFQPLSSMTHNQGNYFDFLHFDQRIADRLAADIGAGNHTANPRQIELGTRQLLGQLARLCTQCVLRTMDQVIEEALRGGQLEDDIARSLRSQLERRSWIIDAMPAS